MEALPKRFLTIGVLCSSLLGLQDYLLNERHYSFFLPGRVNQDCVENLFSNVRQGQPVPNAIAFIQNLKVITLAQYSMAVKESSYDFEEGESFTDFLKITDEKTKQRAASNIGLDLLEMAALPIRQLTDEDCKITQ